MNDIDLEIAMRCFGLAETLTAFPALPPEIRVATLAEASALLRVVGEVMAEVAAEDGPGQAPNPHN